MTQTISTPTSRSTRMPTMSTTKISAPNLRKWKMPCCARIAPIRKVISRMIGTARQPTRSIWFTIEVQRKVVGRIEGAQRGGGDRAEHLAISRSERPTSVMFSPMVASANTIRLRRCRAPAR